MWWSPSHLLSTVVWAATETPLIHGATSLPLLRLGEYHQFGIIRFLASRLENLVENLQHMVEKLSGGSAVHEGTLFDTTENVHR